MKKIQEMGRRTLSVLLSALMMLGIVPLLSFQVSAAPDYEGLQAKLAAIPGGNLRIISGGTASPIAYTGDQLGNKDQYVNGTPRVSYAISAGGQPVWDALLAYAGAVSDLYQNDRANWSGVHAEIWGHDYARGSRGACLADTTGRNNTATRLLATVRGSVTGYDTILRQFSGNFLADTGYTSTGVCDEPTLNCYHTNPFRTNPSRDNWAFGYWPSYGYFTALRTPKQALLLGTHDLNAVPTNLDTALSLAFYHKVVYGPEVQGEAFTLPDVGGGLWFYRAFYHELQAPPDLQVGAAAAGKTGSYDASVAAGGIVNPLKRWRDLDWTTDVAMMSYTDLTTQISFFTTAIDGLNSTSVKTGFANETSSYALSHDNNADLLAWFGLHTYSEGTARKAAMEAALNAILSGLKENYIDYFHRPGSGWLVATTPKPYSVFNTGLSSTAANSLDPRGDSRYNVFTLAELEETYAAGTVKYNTMRAVSLDGTTAAAWSAAVASCGEYAGTVNITAQGIWLENLKRIIDLWKIHEMRDAVEGLLAESAKYHEGYNDVDDGPSSYTYDYQTIQTWYEGAAGDYEFLRVMRNTYNRGTMVTNILGPLEAQLLARRNDLLTEKNYRRDQGYSEEVWYSYRDFFTPLTAYNFADWDTNTLWSLFSSTAANPSGRPRYQGVSPNYTEYKAMSAAARAALGDTLWAQIYGDYAARVIDPLLIQMLTPLAAHMTDQIKQGMDLIRNLESANEIGVKAGGINVLSWGTFGKLKKAIDGLNRELYANLSTIPGGLDMLGYAGYSSAQARADYAFLTGAVLTAYNNFMANPRPWFTQTDLPVANRPARGDDIVGGHSYTDAGDAAMLQLIADLDAMLGAGGDIKLILSAFDLPADLVETLKGLGVDLSAPGPVNLATVIDGITKKMLYSDETLNLLIGSVFPMLLDMLEPLITEQLPKMINSLDPTTMAVTGLKVISINAKPNHLYKILTGSGSIEKLDLYPNEIGARVSALQFPNARNALLAANNGGGDSWAKKAYPTKAWESPGLYRNNPVTGEREFWLDWGINGDESKFKAALSAVLTSVWPLFGAVLCGKDTTIDSNSLGTVSVEAQVLGGWLGTTKATADAKADIFVQGVNGYAKLLTPIFEALLGTDTGTIPTVTQLKGYTSASDLVNAIFNPINAYLAKLKAKPVSEILALLPNLCYAFSLDQVKPLMNDIAINLRISAGDSTLLGIRLGLFTSALDNIEIPEIDISDMLGDTLDFLSMDGLMDMALGALGGGGFALPPFNPGRIATYGRIDTIGSKRYPGPNRHYITADKADVMKALLGSVLGAGYFPLNCENATEAVAAVAELILPKLYPAPAVSYGPTAPAAAQYPSWWANDQGSAKAEADARYLIDNVDPILNIAWEVLFQHSGTTFQQGVEDLLHGLAVNEETFVGLVDMVKELLGSDMVADLLDQFGGLASQFILLNGTPFDLQAIINHLLTYDPTGKTINTVDDLVNALVDYVRPLGQVLDLVLAGKDIKVMPIPFGQAANSLVTIKGYDGYQNGLVPILKAFTEPLGLSALVINQSAFNALPTYDAKLKAILDPLVAVYEKILDAPAISLLDLLPNLVYFMSEPDSATSANPNRLSPLQLSLDALLHPVNVALDTIRPIYGVQKLVSLDAVGLINGLLGDLLGNGMTLDLKSLMVGTWDNTNKVFRANKPGELFALLDAMGALTWLNESGYAGLTYLIKYEKLPDPNKLDYSKAPSAAAAAEYPGWIKESQLNYLADNADAVIKWAWTQLINGEPQIKAWIEGLLAANNVPLSVEDSLEHTVQAVFGNDFFVKDNLTMLVGEVLKLEPMLDIEIPAIDFLGTQPLPLKAVLKELVFLDTGVGAPTPVDLDAIFAPFKAYDPDAVSITNEASFKAALAGLLGPAMPLLRVFLAESNILLIKDTRVNSGNGFLKVYGYNGYENGLRPLLMGLGAGVPGFAATVKSYAAFKAGSEQDQLMAILEPILFLLNAIAKDPVNTALQVAPNAAYLLSDAKGDSLLQQGVNNLLHPVTVLMQFVPALAAMWPASISSLRVGAMLSGLLKFDIEELVVGEIKQFAAPDNQMGKDNRASYVETNKAQLLAQLLAATGAFQLIEQNNMTGLINFLNIDSVKPDGPAKIDYSRAPAPASVTYPSWINKSHTAFIADNADAVLKWAWDTLITGNPDGKAWLSDLLGGGIDIEDSLEATVQALWGNNLYVKENLTKLVGIVVGLKDDIGSISLGDGAPALDLPSLLKKVAAINGAPLDLDAIFAPFEAYDPATVTITDEDSFKAALTTLLVPAVPLLRFLLAGSDVLLINDPDVNGGKGFLKLFGYNGYETGLMPLLMGIGADVPGFSMKSFADFKAGTDAQLLAAILDPILFLVNAIAQDPVQTLLRVAPNAAYVLSDAKGKSILQQALDNLLHPLYIVADSLPMLKEVLPAQLTNLRAGDMINAELAKLLPGLTVEGLVLGTIAQFDYPYNTMGRNNMAYYVAGDGADLLAFILQAAGAFDLLEKNNLTGLINLLNGARPEAPGPIVYPSYSSKLSIYNNLQWTKEKANDLAGNLGKYLDTLWQIIYGKPFGSVPLQAGQTIADTFLGDILGSALYTQENFDSLLNAVQGAIPDILGTEIVPGRSLMDLLNEIVTVNGNTLNLAAILTHIQTWRPAGSCEGQDNFIAALKEYLAPAMPVLDFLLTGADIVVLKDTKINNGLGLLKAYGYDGYRYGLVPLFEALLMPLGGQSEIVKPADFKALDDAGKLDAILHPLLFAVEKIVTNPAENLLSLLPNVCYFVSDGAAVKSPLMQCVDRLLFPLNNVIGAVMGDNGLLSFELDVMGMLDTMLKDLNIGLDAGIIRNLILNTGTDYASYSGYTGRYLYVGPLDRADMLTIVMRYVVEHLKDKGKRAQVLDLLAGSMNLNGFNKGLLKWVLDNMFFWIKLNGTDWALSMIRCLLRLLMSFAPLIARLMGR